MEFRAGLETFKPTQAMTEGEAQILQHLAAALNRFFSLPVEAGTEQMRFAAFVHGAQEMVMARPTRRQLHKENFGEEFTLPT